MNCFSTDLLRCPVCHADMTLADGVLSCCGTRRHCFDVASAGYVNLASAKAAGGGDDADLIRARTAFLSAGHYAPVAREITALLAQYAPSGSVLDAGCGEGYYTGEMARAGHTAFGIDLSKRGVLHAAKSAKRAGTGAFFAVAGIFDLPVRDASFDAVTSIFAPVSEAEFSRVLKKGGVLLLAGAGEEHLYSLKKVLYDTPYRNEPRADLPCGMTLLETRRVRYVAAMENADLQNLFAMTPYFYRTSEAGRARLAATPRLDVDVDVEIAVYRNE